MFSIKMVKGVCCVCHRNVGGFFEERAWRCEGCGRLYCKRCAPKRKGLLSDHPVCPRCGRMLK
ncbi:MAG: hypothetical protein QXX77_08980 [Candidatus Methanosuratincola sp.]